MKLNIYEKKTIVKTYEAETYDLMFGTVEDLLDAIRIDEITSGTDDEIIKAAINLVTHGLDTVKDLLKDVFDGLTDEELKHTKVKELANVIVEIITFSFNQMSMGNTSKN